MQEYKEHRPDTSLILPANQTSMWDSIRFFGSAAQQVSPFSEGASGRSPPPHAGTAQAVVGKPCRHEYPSPYAHYKIGVYIRFFNQTKYDNYLSVP